ncbi:zinc finger MYM-type protein 4-like [Anableps anableps]
MTLITQPQKVILAPVDDSGTVKELCSDTCLTSVKAKMLHASCKLCGKTVSCKETTCKFSVTVDGEVNRLCSDLLRLRLPVRLTLQTHDGVKNRLRDECLVKLKEGRNMYGTENRSSNSEETDVKDVKPCLPQIKEEPVDQEYFLKRSHSVSPQSIKEEPDAPKEDLKIGSVFSLTEDSKPPRPTLAHMDLPASCSSCKRVLLDGETVYQRKAHSDLFCSTSCLLSFHQLKAGDCEAFSQSCRRRLDDEGTKKDFCSQSCLSSFNYKRVMSTKLPIVPAASQSQCSVCSRFCIRPLLPTASATSTTCRCARNCGSRCSSLLRLKTEDGSKSLCGSKCLKLFKQKIQTLQLCSMCCKSKLISDMFENKTSEEVVELFCSSSCVMASKIQAVCSSGVPLSCDHCRKTAAPACHLAMSDASIRSFCCLTCAMAFKETQKDQISRTSEAVPCTQPQRNSYVAQCQEVIKTAPRGIQKKEEVIFVCSLVCSKKFKKLNNILGVCERCRKKRIIHEVQRVENKDCSFCSDGCFLLFHRELEKKWGKPLFSCSFCLSASRTVLSAQAGGSKKDFCSEACSSKYRALVSHEAKCATCGRRGKLTESLPLPGNVKHFCDLKCLLRSRKDQG